MLSRIVSSLYQLLRYHKVNRDDDTPKSITTQLTRCGIISCHLANISRTTTEPVSRYESYESLERADFSANGLDRTDLWKIDVLTIILVAFQCEYDVNGVHESLLLRRGRKTKRRRQTTLKINRAPTPLKNKMF